jgi:hypothetical protein
MRTIEPRTITQGEQIEWTRCFSEFPADEWELQYRFRGPGTGFNIDATADGTDFLAIATAEQAGEMTSGKYTWQAWATNITDSSDIRMIGSGSVTVELGFSESTTTEVDLRSTAKQIVDALEAALLGTASREQMEYEVSTPVGSRRVKYMSRKEQTDLLEYYKKIVARELAADRVKNGGRYGTQVKVRMRES